MGTAGAFLCFSLQFIYDAKENREIFFGVINNYMNNYIATVRIKGRTARTRIAADSTIQARWLLEFMFGRDSVITGPTLAETKDRAVVDAQSLYLADTQIYPSAAASSKSSRSQSPAQSAEQARIQQLRTQKSHAAQALKRAQQQSRVARAQRQLQTAIKAQQGPLRTSTT